jgi:hypothetical protein
VLHLLAMMMPTKKPEKRLVRADLQLATGKKAARAQKKKVKRSKGDKVKLANAKRALKTIETGLEAIEDERDALLDEVKDKERRAR